MSKVEDLLIKILIDKSKYLGRILEYKDLNQVKIILDQDNVQYDDSDLEDLDLTYVNIKVEDILLNNEGV